MKKLNNKTTLITGATSGIGRACALFFAAEGSNLILNARREEPLFQLKEELETKYGISCHVSKCDVRDLTSVKAFVKSIPESFQKVDILINNAGLARGFDAVQTGSIEDWDEMIDTNIKGLLYITREVLPLMTAHNEGHIINLGSAAGHDVYPKGNVYCATKYAVKALSEGFRMDLLEHGIKVTSVDPGMVETNFSVIRFHGDEDKAKNVYKGFDPLTAEDIADVILFAATRPLNVNLNQIIMTPRAQANTIFISRK